MASLKVVELAPFLRSHPDAFALLLSGRENVICRNAKTGRVRKVQARALYQNNSRFWEMKSAWTYYIDRDTAAAIEQQINARAEAATQKRAGDELGDEQSNEQSNEPAAHEADEAPEVAQSVPAERNRSNFGTEYDRYAQLDQESRIGILQAATRRLEALEKSEKLEELEVAEALVETTKDAALANRATLLEALRLGNDEAKAYTQQMVIETHKMVKGSVRLVESDVYDDDLMREIVEKSNGTVVQHMTRVFLMGVEFMLYYNRQVMTKGIANRIRTRFTREFKRYYRKLLPQLHEDYVSLEHVFFGGMKALSEVEINKFATGFLVHDVGKADDIEYHEGDQGYDRETVERHVKIGYRIVMEKTNYPREAALITGYHHEYYGAAAGYGYFREFLQAYKEANPAASQDYVMAYTMEPLIDFEVLAYFPAKMLEIVDVFDSLTDPNRIYRKPMEPDDALAMMREQFVEEHLKLDPILFQLFLDFLEARGSKSTRKS